MAMLAVKPVASVSALRRSARCAPALSRTRRSVNVTALLGPDGKPSTTSGKKSSGISREEEPEQYWSSPSEKPGANPLTDPLAIIGILAILFPFIFLGIAIGAGYIDISVYR